MAAPADYYVDPGAADDSGNGLSTSTPWGPRSSGKGAIQHALDTITRSSNGDRINVKSGTSDVLNEDLNLDNYGYAANDGPLIIQGYQSEAGDGGQGGIDCAATYQLFLHSDTNADNIFLIDLKIHNGPNNIEMISLNNGCMIHRCEITGCFNGGNFIHMNLYGCFSHNYLHGVYGTVDLKASYCVGNVFKYNGMINRAITVYDDTFFINNFITVTMYTSGVVVFGRKVLIANNSILSDSGTGSGIDWDAETEGGVIINNVIEGFSGSGGGAINFRSKATNKMLYANNSWYQCETPELNKISGEYAIETGNELLSGSPFAKSGTLNWANRETYFAPQDVGSVYGGSFYGNQDRGAVQHAESGGGSGPVVIRRPDFLIGR